MRPIPSPTLILLVANISVKQFFIIPLLALVVNVSVAQNPSGAEVLYNGIALPKEWPPTVSWEDIQARKPLADPPYLRSPPALISIDVGRQLFVDDFLIADTTGLTRTYHLAKYHAGNPVFSGGMVFSDGVWHDPKDHLFKMWYFDHGTGYTTSKDGVHWEPGTNVLSGETDSQTVWLDLEEKDASKRFKMIRSVIANNDCRGQIYFSPDGVEWRHMGQTGSWGDRSTFFYNPFRKIWVISVRHGWGQPRARRYWEVKDLEKGPYWGEADQPQYPPFWIGSDSLDLERPDYKIPCELYNLDCVAYESLMLGLFTIWRGQPGPRQKPNEVCVGFSRDGFHWSRPDRRPFCPVSETPGDWNYANVQSAGGCCLIVGGQLYFYVSGRGKGRVTSLATLRRDGFASMDGDFFGGTLTTRPVRFSGRYFFVNLEAPSGGVWIEVFSEDGKRLLTSDRIKGDKTLLPVSWKDADDLSVLAGKPVRFRFHLYDGKLYSFWVTPDKSGASHGYVAAGGPGFTGPINTVGAAR
ncbi:MAG: glycosyl hydrolase family 32 [Verrucomicrobia bacterium]|nr:MAG: glycosyl hydrolase family 32 [Verrucomicrobiota bacterium]